MELGIFSKEKGYISAHEAAEKTGYTSDYIGQLCRRRKVPARLVGRAWHVDLDALLEHKENTQPGRKKSYSPVRKSTMSKAELWTGEGARLKPVSSVLATYQNEIGPLLPELFKKASLTGPSVAFELIKQAAALATALILVTTTGLYLLERASPQAYSQVEAGSQMVAAPVLSSVSSSFQAFSTGFLELREIAAWYYVKQ